MAMHHVPQVVHQQELAAPARHGDAPGQEVIHMSVLWQGDHQPGAREGAPHHAHKHQLLPLRSVRGDVQAQVSSR